MSTSKSSPKTTTTTTDLRTTNTLNAGLEGDISDAFVAAGNYGTTAISSDSSDNSLDVEMSDYSDRSINDYSDRSFSDSSDNSLTMDLEDNSNRSVYTNSSTNHITDGGAFSLVRDLGSDVIESLGESQTETLGAVNKVISGSYDFVNNSQDNLFGAVEKLVTKALDSSVDIAQQSLQGAMQIKAGQAITEPANQTVRELAAVGLKVAAIGGAVYLGSKYLKG